MNLILPLTAVIKTRSGTPLFPGIGKFDQDLKQKAACLSLLLTSNNRKGRLLRLRWITAFRPSMTDPKDSKERELIILHLSRALLS